MFFGLCCCIDNIYPYGYILSMVIDAGQLVAIKGHKTVIDTNSLEVRISKLWRYEFHLRKLADLTIVLRCGVVVT